MPEFLYRFRPIRSVLGDRKELANQEIYFASPGEQNDPMEGFKDFYWDGDEVVWRNLFRHYLLCLEHAHTLAFLGASDADVRNIAVFLSDANLATAQHLKVFQHICDAFFADASLPAYLKQLTSRAKPVRRNELLYHLRRLHARASRAVLEVHESHGLRPQGPANAPLQAAADKAMTELEAFTRKLNDLDKKTMADQHGAVEHMCAGLNGIHAESYLIERYHSPIDKKIETLFVEFPELYVNALERLVHPAWYAACFNESAANPSVWAHYAESHRGVCLKFRPVAGPNGQQVMNLHGVTGTSFAEGKTTRAYGTLSLPLHKVRYTPDFPEIDFFGSMGSLTRSVLSSFWYRDEQGNRSRCAEGIFDNETEWRAKHWNTFTEGYTTKLEDWAYEKEHRLILTGTVTDRTDKSTRKLKYKMTDLDGIIFGIKTSTEDKLAVMKVAEEQCNKAGYDGLKFYQARYSRKSRQIDIVEMRFLKLKP